MVLQGVGCAERKNKNQGVALLAPVTKKSLCILGFFTLRVESTKRRESRHTPRR
jgi:hypothetical protein